MLRQTVDNRAPFLLFPSFSPLTVTFPELSVIFHPLCNEWRIRLPTSDSQEFSSEKVEREVSVYKKI
jgi:hypothetical protein